MGLIIVILRKSLNQVFNKGQKPMIHQGLFRFLSGFLPGRFIAKFTYFSLGLIQVYVCRRQAS